MIACFLTPVYLLVNSYILWRLLQWLQICHTLFSHPLIQIGIILLYVLLASSPLTSFLIKHPSWLQRLLKHMNNYYLGMLLYTILILLVTELLRMTLNYVFHASWIESSLAGLLMGILCISFVILIILLGGIRARQLQTTHYEITIPKSLSSQRDSLKVILLADTHFGYSVGTKTADLLAKKINEEHPDLICFAGDIFDNHFDAIRDPASIQKALRSFQSTYGTYACWGNHDLEEPILAGFTFQKTASPKEDPRMTRFLKESGITLLEDKSVLIDQQFYLIGRHDPSRSKKLKISRKEPDDLLKPLDSSKPLIVLDHQPKQLQKLSKAGADLDLCGHTHDGQLFPGNLLTSIRWKNSCGYHKYRQMHSIVTSGVGIWGPNMRVGTTGEICVIHIHFLPEDPHSA